MGIIDIPMVKIDWLTFSYGRKKPLFDNFSLSLQAGKAVGLLGRNGTGKSTLLYLMCGLLHPKKGRIEFKGMDVTRCGVEMLSNVFLVPEEFSLPNISLRKYVELYAPFYPAFSDNLLQSCLRNFDLEDDIRLGELSMGQKKKAFMAFALAANTALLLLDEPTNGLDIPSKIQFRKVVADCMNDERTLVISTHQVLDIDKLLTHLVMIDNAKLLLDEDVSTIIEKTGKPLDIEQLFNDIIYNRETLQELFKK